MLSAIERRYKSFISRIADSASAYPLMILHLASMSSNRLTIAYNPILPRRKDIPLRRQGWSVPRSRFCSSDNAFRPFPISCVIQILQICTRVQKSKNAIGFSKARRKVSPYPCFQLLSILELMHPIRSSVIKELRPVRATTRFQFDTFVTRAHLNPYKTH